MSYDDLLVYKRLPFDLSKRIIRVLHLLPRTDGIICGKLELQNLEDSTQQYACVSYVWGDAAVTRPIQIEGQELQVTTNLFDFLAHMRHPHDTIVLWIDAICIDQDNLTERSHQVAMMGEIYSRCSTVHVWLGTPSDPKSIKRDPFELFDHFATMKHYHDLPGYTRGRKGGGRFWKREWIFQENDDFKHLWDAFLHVVDNRWWTRAWTVQEIILPAHSIVWYGTWKTSWDTIAIARERRNDQLYSCCWQSHKAFPSKFGRKLDVFLGEVERIDTMHYPRHETKKPLVAKEMISHFRLPPPNFHEIVLSFASRECKDPRDKIFSLLGMLPTTIFDGYKPNYSGTTAESYTEFCKRTIEASSNHYQILLGAGLSEMHPDLPSWARDFSKVLPLASVVLELYKLRAYPLFNCSKGRTCRLHIANDRELHLEALNVDTILAIGPAMNLIRDDPSEVISGVLLEWRRFCGEALGTEDKALIRKALSQVVCATLILDPSVEHGWRRCTKGDVPSAFAWQKFIDGNVAALDDAYLGAVELATAGRSMFITRAGNIGLCSPGAQPGDAIWS